MIRSLLISFLFITTILSCSQPEESWVENIIKSESEILMVTSIDLMQLIEKVDLANNNKLSLDQKMMYKAFMSTFNSESLGFDIEKYHRLFVIPEYGKLNAGVFLAGDITNKKNFEDFLINYFGATSFSGTDLTSCSIEEFNLQLGFNNEHFIAGISGDNSYLESKINVLFNEDKLPSNDEGLNNYLSKRDDMNCYLSTEKLFGFLNDVNNPLIQSQLPKINELKEFGSVINLSMNFNDGNFTMKGNSNMSTTSNISFYSNNGVDKKYQNFLTDNDELIMFAFLNMLPENLISQMDQLSKLGVTNELNNVLYNMGTNINELLQILDGQMSFSLAGFPNSGDMSSNETGSLNDSEDYWEDDEFDDLDYNNEVASNSQENIPSVLISMGVKETGALISLLSKNNIVMENNVVLSIGMGINMLIKDNTYHISTNKKLIDKIKSNGELNSCSAVEGDYFEQPLYGFIDLDTQSWPEELLKELNQSSVGVNVLEYFEKVTITGSNNEAMFKIDFSNQNENSLKTIIDLIISQRIIENYI